MSKYFTDDGWLTVAPLFECEQAFCTAVSARGPGKTYSAINWLTEHCTEEAKFIHMRRTKTELEEMEAENPYKEINRDFDRKIEMVREKKKTRVLRDGEPIGVHMSLHGVSGVRGINMFDYKYWLFDEIIPEHGAYKKKREDIIMSNAYESINRNRELKGEPPIKLVMLSNLNAYYSEILEAFGYTDELERMHEADPIAIIADKDRKLLMVNNTDISSRKQDTALYRVTKSKEFVDMALNNAKNDSVMPIKNYARNTYTYLVTLGEVNVNQLKNGQYYLTKSNKPNEPDKATLIRWSKIYAEYTRGWVSANSNYAAMKFIQLFNG